MIDEDRIRELRDEIGAEDLDLVLDLFLAEAGETLSGIEAGQSAEALERAMHFLRSGALNMGLSGFADAASAVEDERPDDPLPAVARLRAILDRTQAALKAA